MKQTYHYLEQSCSIELTPSNKGYLATIGAETVRVELLRAAAGQLDLLIDGKPVSAVVSADGSKRWVTVKGQTLILTKASATRKGGGTKAHALGQLFAPMPGQVRAIQVVEGALVTKNQTLLIIEAMKMEIKITAPGAGLVKSIPVKVGQTVEREQILAEIELT